MPVGHSVTFVIVAHVPKVVCNGNKFLNFPMFITKVVFCWLSVTFAIMCTSSLPFQIIAVRWPLTCHPVIHLQFCLTVLLCVGHQINWERSGNSPDKVYDLHRVKSGKYGECPNASICGLQVIYQKCCMGRRNLMLWNPPVQPKIWSFSCHKHESRMLGSQWALISHPFSHFFHIWFSFYYCW